MAATLTTKLTSSARLAVVFVYWAAKIFVALFIASLVTVALVRLLPSESRVTRSPVGSHAPVSQRP